jgi:L-ascorbate metabolism protein UlaG (beta-lactamase superfamily)
MTLRFLRGVAIGALMLFASPLSLGGAQQQTGGLTMTFLANEGVMLASGGKKVLIDALFLKYKTGFATPADSTQAALAAARPPFDNVDLILATHYHGDHFHPQPVAAHLTANPRATLATSSQVIDSLRGRVRAGGPLDSRILVRTTAPGARRREVINGIPVEFLGIPHGTGPSNHLAIEHLVYIVELGGKRVLHVGDAILSDENVRAFRLDTARIDVALVPTWVATGRSSRQAIERWVKPKQVVAFHVGEGGGERASREVRAVMPGAITLRRERETHRW